MTERRPGSAGNASSRVVMHLVVWLCVFAVWVVATRRYHPTFEIALSATAVLISGSAAGVYTNALVLVPRFAQPRRWWQYLGSLVMTVVVLDLIAVPAIQLIYDWLWRPDPLRFGYWFNMASDGAIILLHILIATLVSYLTRSKTTHHRQDRREATEV